MARMAGINRGLPIPVLVEGNSEVVSNRGKTDLLVETFQRVHSTSNLGAVEQLRRREMLEEERHMGSIYFSLCRS